MYNKAVVKNLQNKNTPDAKSGVILYGFYFTTLFDLST